MSKSEVNSLCISIQRQIINNNKNLFVEKLSVLKELREKFQLVNQELNDRMKNNELKNEQLNQTKETMDGLKHQVYARHVRLSNLKHDYRKLLNSTKELRNASPLTDNPSLHLDYERTQQSMKQRQTIINKFKVDLSD